MCMNNELTRHLDQVHLTEKGVERVKKNMKLKNSNILKWCLHVIKEDEVIATQSGKNWYVNDGECIITINAKSYTIITAHPINI